MLLQKSKNILKRRKVPLFELHIKSMSFRSISGLDCLRKLFANIHVISLLHA